VRQIAGPHDPRRVAASALANYFFAFISFGIFAPFFQLYLKARGLSPSRIGIVLGIMGLAGVAGPLFLGAIADRRTAYRALLAASFLVPAAVMILLQATSLFPIYVACVIVMGFANSPAIPLLDSIVSRILVDPARQYGRLRVAGSLGFITISLVIQLSGLITGDSSLSILIAFGASSVCAATATAFLPPAHRVQTPPGTAGTGLHSGHDGFDLRFWAVIGIIFLGRFGIGVYYSFFSLYLKQAFPASGVSLLWAIGPLAEIPTLWFSGPLIKRFGIRAMLTVSLAAISLRLGLFIVAPSIAVIALAQLLHAFTFGTFHAGAVSYVNSKVAANNRGMGMAIYNAVGIGLASFLASSIGGFILEAHGFRSLFVTYAAIPLAGIAVLVVFGRRLMMPRRASADAAPATM
jgi:MFS transporter, PPP family, 3-phenylpropionic acid transporter